MKKIISFIFFMLFMLFILANTLTATDLLYVQSVKAKILSNPKFDSKLIGCVNRGDSLELIESDNGWHRVSASSFDGWIHRLCVANTPPMQRVTVIKESETTLDQNARRRASSTTSAAAARGLTSGDRERLNNKNQPNYNELNKLEKFAEKITKKELDEFMLSFSNGGS